MRLWTNDGEFRVTGWMGWLLTILLTVGVCGGAWFGGFNGSVAGVAPGAALTALIMQMPGERTHTADFPPRTVRPARTEEDWKQAWIRAALVGGGLIVLAIVADWWAIRVG